MGLLLILPLLVYLVELVLLEVKLMGQGPCRFEQLDRE